MKKKLWNQSKARESLLGRDTDTMNPSIAARSLLGRASVARAERKQKFRRRFHRGNPSLASVGSLIPGGGIFSSILGGLGGRFKAPSEKRAAKVIPQLMAAAIAGNLTAARAIIERATSTGGAGVTKTAEKVLWDHALTQLPPALIATTRKYMSQIPGIDHSNPEAAAQSALSRPFTVPGAGASPAATFLSSPGAASAITGVVRAIAPRRGRGGRQRYPSYTDRYGRQRYSYRPPGSEMRIPQGATPTAGTPYNFFRGAVGQGGALATAGQLALAAGAGVGAYLVTQKLLARLGGRAQSQEEAGVNAAAALHEAMEDYKRQHGTYPPPAERAQMKATYRAKLAELGYDPDTFTRTRSGFESFVEDYNPLGG